MSYFVGVAADYRADFLLLPELVAAQMLSDLGAKICTDTRQSYLRVRYGAQARAVENQLRLDRRADLFRLLSLLPADQASSGPKDGLLGGPPGKS